MIPTLGKTYKIKYVDYPVTILSPYGQPANQQWLGVYTASGETHSAICQADTIEAEAVVTAMLDVHLVPGDGAGQYKAVAVAAGQDVPGSVGKSACQVTVFEEARDEKPKRRAGKSARRVRGAK